jgi:hypothetical protein
VAEVVTMPSRDRRSKGLAARQAARKQSALEYVDLAALEAHRADLLAAALASTAALQDTPSTDVAAAWAPAIDLVGTGVPVAEVAALLDIDPTRLDALSR